MSFAQNVMPHVEHILRSPDGADLFMRIWEPEAPPRAAIAVIHGLGEHSGRYMQVAEFLNRRGHALAAIDLRGHGRTAGTRGHVPGLETVHGDIHALLQNLAARHPDRPCFLYGHSLGALFVLDHAIRRRPANLAGIIATSPALRPAQPPPRLLKLAARLLRRVVPRLTLSSQLDDTGLSRDPRVVSEYRADPLVHGRVSAQLGIELLDAGEWVLANRANFPLPLLLMHGTADRLTSCAASQAFADGAGARVTFKTWEGGYHELHNDLPRDQVLEYLADWIETRVTGRAS